MTLAVNNARSEANVAANVGRKHTTRRSAFVPAVISLIAVFATVGSTIPLFNIYRAEDGFTNAGISLTVVAYSAATLVTLLVFGRLSHHVGRRPVAIGSLLLLVAGSLVLLDVHHIGILITGRVLMGLGAGLASSSLTSYVVDAAPAKPAWLASVASSQTVMLGLAVGAIASGALIQFAPWPRELTFLVVIGLLLASVALVATSPETATRTPGGLLHGSSLAQRSPIFSVVYLLSYSGATIPALIAGHLTSTFSLTQIALGYSGLALAATLVTVIAARNPQSA